MSVPAYDCYMDSGVEWLGAVPSHWSVVPLRSQFSELTGKNNGLVSTDYLSLVAGRGVMPYAEKGDIGNKRPDDLEKCKIVRAGNFVINSMNFGIGAFGVSAYDGVCSPVYVILRPNEKRSLGFLRWIFDNPGFRQTAQSFGNGILAHRSAIGWDELRAMPAAIPPLAEQAEIAAFLDRETGKIDALVEAQTRLIELLKEKRQAVISHAVTKGLDPAAPMKDSGVEWLGQVPAHWEVKPIKAVASYNDDVLTEATPPDHEIAYVEISDVQAGVGIAGSTAYAFSDAPSRARRRVQCGDIIVSTVRTYLRAIAAVTAPADNMIVSTGFAVIRPRAINSRFIGYALLAEQTINEIIARSVGISYPAINASDLVRIPVSVPPLPEQVAIATFLDRATAKIDALLNVAEEAIALLQERRAALISAAVTGKIDVRGLAHKQAEAA